MFRSTVIDVVDMIDYVLDSIEIDMIDTKGLETIFEEGYDYSLIEDNYINMNDIVKRTSDDTRDNIMYPIKKIKT